MLPLTEVEDAPEDVGCAAPPMLTCDGGVYCCDGPRLVGALVVVVIIPPLGPRGAPPGGDAAAGGNTNAPGGTDTPPP